MKQTIKLGHIRKILLYVSIGLLAISALLGIIAILFGEMEWRIITTTFLAGIASIIAMGCVTRLEEPQPLIKTLTILTLILDMVWFALSLCLLWYEIGDMIWCGGHLGDYSGCYEAQNLVLKWSITAFIFTVVLSLLSRFMTIKGNTSITSLKLLTIVSAVMCGLCGLIIVWKANELATDNMWRLLAVFAILVVFGIVVTPILVRLNKSKNKPKLSDEEERKLRQEIEREVRAKIAAEQQSQTDDDKTDITGRD